MLKEKNQEKHDQRFKGCEENGSEKNYILKKSPSVALDCQMSAVFGTRFETGIGVTLFMKIMYIGRSEIHSSML